MRVLHGPSLPSRLRDLEPTPEQLWGRLPQGPAVAVVGTRRASEEACRFTQEICADLARRGVCVLSGGALGVDTVAHESALAAGGHTLIVAPTGLEDATPAVNRPLFERALDSGGYLSVQPPGKTAKLHHFFSRNAVLAALAHVVVAIESPLRSGTRNTSSRARKLGRPLYWVPAPPWESRRAGFWPEYRQGGVRLLHSSRDLLDALARQRLYGVLPPGAQLSLLPEDSAPGDRTTVSEEPASSRSEPASRLLRGLSESPRSLEELAALLNEPEAKLRRELFELGMRGIVDWDELGRYRLALT